MKKYTVEKTGQIDFFDTFRIDYKNYPVLVDNTDGVWKGNLLEFKLQISNLNAVVFQAIKYLSKMRVKGESIPSNIVLVSLNESLAYIYKSKDFYTDIHKIYIGAASQHNDAFVSSAEYKKIDYSKQEGVFDLLTILRETEYLPIDIDENCVVGWAERYYRENPKATKGDFLGDNTGKIKVIGEIRQPRHFAGLINPYTKETNEKFKYLMDKLNDRLKKSELGAFYTPIPYCKKVIELIQKAINLVPEGNDYIILDRCAGTGNLEAVLSDEMLSHCILSTYEYYEYKVLVERLADKVLTIIPPIEMEDTYDRGLVRCADAMSKEYLDNPIIKKYVDDPKCTIILLENPPYQDSSTITFNEGDVTKRASVARNESYVKAEFKKELNLLNEQRGAARDISNLFIWSGIKYYLRQDTDSYILFSPVKYFKTIGLCKKEFVDGFLFNREHFHASPSAISCILWRNIDEENRESFPLKAFDIDKNGDVQFVKTVTVRKCKKNFAFYNELDSDESDIETNVACKSNGYQNEDWTYKKGRKSYFNTNIVGYLATLGFSIDMKHINLLRMPYTTGLEQSFGYILRKDYYLKKLPLFAAKLYPQDNWYERDVYFNTADKGEEYLKDDELIKESLIFACLSQYNKCLSFIGTDKRFYQNELCFEDGTVASEELSKQKLNSDEKELIDLFRKILNEAKETKNYKSDLKYGVYQINLELNTFVRDEELDKNVYDYPELNGDLTSLKSKLKKYYKEYIEPKLFKYELIK